MIRINIIKLNIISTILLVTAISFMANNAFSQVGRPVTTEQKTPKKVKLSTESMQDINDYSGYYPNVEAGKYDNGKMWTFSYPPNQYFKDTYGFEPSDEWVESVRMSALRFSTYCTASFVSEDGLVMTNHHCGRESVTEVTTPEEDLPKNGFYATTLEEERKVKGLFVDQLVAMEDVTKSINDAISFGKTDADKTKLKNDKIDELVKANETKTGMKVQIHTFYNGSIYQMYTYKRYTDVRLVMAPETDLGFFGGDPDNFTYPRYTLDFTFFRVYGDDGKPLQTKYHFTWSKDGAEGNEPLFVIGNPGTTKRLNTVAMLEYDRDFTIPHVIDLMKTLTSSYEAYMDAHPESKLELTDTYFGYTNSLKAYNGIYGGLKDPNMMGKRANFEKSFKAAIASKPELQAKYGDLWGKIAESRKELRKYYGKQIIFSPANSRSELFALGARAIDLATEMKKPADKRSPGNSDEDLKGKVAKLKLDQSYHKEIEEKIVEFQLSKVSKWSMNKLRLIDGDNNPLLIPAQAKALVAGTIVADAGKLADLFAKGPDAVLNSKDPVLAYAKMAKDSLAYYKTIIDPIASAETQNIQLLGQALYSVYGTSIPPDANFTLRFADGILKAYDYNGTTAPEFTTFYGLFDKYYSYGKKEPWNLPKKWLDAESTMNKGTKLNYVTTHDIIGGNSGSAMINQKGQVVGLIFDGNIESLPSRYIYDVDSNNRCVSLHSSGILEALRSVYKADKLADELQYSKIK
ncbi:MAG: S46 family peptidase [Saprospiraceae bacterium]|nr:S46 family peptidase [Candidatus Brachybacter algidus]MBL0118424.1 S46 family peptidase [Candidatus Brachybacter algidus]